MNPPIAEHAPEGGRNDQNARPASIRKGGRLQSETVADFAGMRTLSRKGKKSTVVATAIARELAAFIWAIAREVNAMPARAT